MGEDREIDRRGEGLTDSPMSSQGAALTTLRILNRDQTYEVSEGCTLLEACDASGLFVDTSCGGNGLCGKCKLLVVEGDLSVLPIEREFLRPDEIAEGIRLGCRKRIHGRAAVKLLQEDLNVHAKLKLFRQELGGVAPKSGVEKHVVDLEPPSGEGVGSVWEKVAERLPAEAAKARPGLDALQRLSTEPLGENSRASITVSGDEVLHVEWGDTRYHIYGVAVDVGTTTLACHLVDLLTGRTIGFAAAGNSQRAHGADLMSRLDYALREKGGLRRLGRAVLKDVNSLIHDVAHRAGISKENIYKLVLAGNTAMQHMFFGLDIRFLGRAPYVPIVEGEIAFRAKDLGLEANPSALGFFLPPIAAFVGSDTLAMILAEGLDKRPGITLAVDVGTNAESVLARDGELLCCSNPAGPAFEGASIEAGMRAVPGAIDSVSLDGRVSFTTIEEAPPKGLCGSGIIDAVAEMRRIGCLEVSGRMRDRDALGDGVDDLFGERMERTNLGNRFLLVPPEQSADGRPVFVTQKDIREVQLAGGGIRAGVDILLREMGITPDSIDEILIAGAFGNYLSPDSARRIGLIPPVPLDRVRFVGNSAGTGARLALVSEDLHERARQLAGRVRHVNLGGRADFQRFFVEAMKFPDLDD